MKQQSLNGVWQYRIGKGKERAQQVPFSALAVGHSECRRSFDLTEEGERVLLRFDGINYAARVTLNGCLLGELLAYCEYTFEVTDIVKKKDNELLVELEDLSPAFGPSEGWENYGGITRPVSLLYTGKTYIEDVFFHTELKNEYTDADYTVELLANGEQSGDYRITLSYLGREVDACTVPVGTKQLTRSLTGVCLWSPDTPNLYDLKVELLQDGKVTDVYTHCVGFRSFSQNRHRFLLNGQELFLLGVCKHEMVGDSIHTLTAEEIERDLRLIKETGCNYVRLVHYPHDKRTLEIADRIGILTSEEPGLWWSDTSNPAVSGGALEVLRRTVLRDRNHASIAFWLSFNECKFTLQYLKDAARVARENDPTRMVSGANCMSDDETLVNFNECGFDFYTMHPYWQSPSRGIRSAAVLHDKPLLFTEWGGFHVSGDPKQMSNFIHAYYNLYLANSDQGALAGACFWYWAEVNDFHRGSPACKNGVLKEALVDKYRNPTENYGVFRSVWQEVLSGNRHRKGWYPEYRELYRYNALDPMKKTALNCDAQTDFEVLFAEVEKDPARPLSMRKRQMVIGPCLAIEEVPGIACTPYVLTDGNELAFAGKLSAGEVSLLCAAGLKGYPLGGAYGEAAAEVTVSYTDGSAETFPLRNGVEFTTVYTTKGSSRIEPYAENATRFATFGYEYDFENYLINRLDLPADPSKTLRQVTLRSLDRGYNLLIWGVFA